VFSKDKTPLSFCFITLSLSKRTFPSTSSGGINPFSVVVITTKDEKGGGKTDELTNFATFLLAGIISESFFVVFVVFVVIKTGFKM